MSDTTRSITLSDGVRIVVDDVGDGPAVLLHQGFSLTRTVWDPVVSQLSDRYRCVTFDPRGHGTSDAPETGYALDRLATDVGEIAAELGLRDATLVGHSMGGAISFVAAVEQAASAPFSRLVLLGPAIPSFVERAGQPYGVPSATYQALAERIAVDFAGSARDTAGIFFHQTDQDLARRTFDDTLTMRPDVAAQLFAELGTVDLGGRLREVPVPVLALWGEHDVLSDPRWAGWFRDLDLPGWEIGTLADSGHGPMLDEPEALAARIAGFIEDTPSPVATSGSARRP